MLSSVWSWPVDSCREYSPDCGAGIMAAETKVRQLKGRGVRCTLRFFNRKIYGRCVRKGPAGRRLNAVPPSNRAAIVVVRIAFRNKMFCIFSRVSSWFCPDGLAKNQRSALA